ncbi:MAG TPA: TIGR01244 family sulfur transferase [Caulobacterales bacterium]|nr:TIGR01244 family sulfur transferase [Caulobacterales bacterium]
MTEFRRVTAAFSVAPQIGLDDIARAAAEGFRVLINNRPDNEAPGQMTSAEAERAAKAAGLDYHALPFAGPPPPAVVAQTETLLEQASGPVLAYCRSGTRSVTAWALAQALAGALSPDEIVQRAAEAGYDLSGARPALESLSPR